MFAGGMFTPTTYPAGGQQKDDRKRPDAGEAKKTAETNGAETKGRPQGKS